MREVDPDIENLMFSRADYAERALIGALLGDYEKKSHILSIPQHVCREPLPFLRFFPNSLG